MKTSQVDMLQNPDKVRTKNGTYLILENEVRLVQGVPRMVRRMVRVGPDGLRMGKPVTFRPGDIIARAGKGSDYWGKGSSSL